MRTNRFVLLGGVAMLAFTSVPAMAQDESEGDDQTQVRQEGIDTIFVTADLTRANVQDLSQSVSVITGEEIEATQAVTLDQVLRNVPALNIQGGFNNLYLRGVGSNQGPGDGGEPGVSVNVDGANAYSANRTSTLSTLVDIERVEVLRGPQGTLYGRNATGGVVNIITRDPQLGTWEGSATIRYGNYDLQSYAGVLNVPLGDTLAFRANVTRETRDGYIHDANDVPISGDTDIWNVRGKLLFEPTSDFSILGTFNLVHDQSNSSMGVPNIRPATADDLAGLPPAPPVPPFNGSWEPVTRGHPDDPWRNDSGTVPAAPGEIKSYFYQADVNWDVGFANLTFIPTYTKIHQVCNTAVTPICPPANSDQTTLEFRAANPVDSPIQWTVGAYYLHQAGSAAPTATGLDLNTEIDINNARNGTDINGNLLVELETAQLVLPTNNYALFGHIVVPLAESLRGVAGFRWSEESKRNQYILYGVQGTPLPPGPPPPPGTLCSDCTIAFQNDPIVEDTSHQPFTWQLGLEYDAGPDSMLYATVSTGFKAGGIAPVVVPPQLYQQEKLLSFAIGSKNRFANNTLQLNAEAYYYRYDNYQINIANEAPIEIDSNGVTYADPNEFRSITYNADLGEVLGFEIETIWEPTDRDVFRINVAYNNGEYGALVAPLGGPPFLPSDFTLTGGDMAFSPDWTFNASYGHTFDLFGGELTPRVDFRYSDSYLVTAESYLSNFWAFIGGGRYETEQRAFAKLDAYINYVTASGMVSINAFARNLTKHAEIEFLNPGGVAVSPPRTYGIGTTVRF